ncbi:hypothetical protein VUR80DRAFT_1989 [Thermomyces stellatus]
MSDTLVTLPRAGKVSLETQLHDTLPDAFMPHQVPLTVTLDDAAVLGPVLAAVITACFISSLYIELLIATSVAVLVYHDYRNFLNLGPGGVPSTFRGYLTISWLRLFALRDPLSPPPSDPTRSPHHGILFRSLPSRKGPRPKVAGIIPHRQLDQRGAKGACPSLRAALRSLAAAHPDTLATARSCFEKHGLGLFARHPVNETCRGEILHIHDSDRAMHMNLHPEDIRAVLEGGWGERHPLARRYMHVNETFMLIYAPRGMFSLPPPSRVLRAFQLNCVW